MGKILYRLGVPCFSAWEIAFSKSFQKSVSFFLSSFFSFNSTVRK